MIYYLIPTLGSLLIFASLFFHYRKFRNVYIVLSTFILYYWSVAGSFFFVYERQNPVAGEKMGIHFQHYLKILYPVALDDTYLVCTTLYSLFVLAFVWGSFFVFWAKKPELPTAPSKPIEVNPVLLLLPAVAGMLISLWAVRYEVMDSIRHFRSFYIGINNHTQQRFHTLHLAANSLMAISAFAFLGIAMAKNGKFMVLNRSSKWIYGAGIALFVLILGYLVLLGSRNYFIFGALLIFVFVYENNGWHRWFRHAVISGILLVVPLFLTELTRGTPIVSLAIYELQGGKHSGTRGPNTSLLDEGDKNETYAVSGASTLHSLLYSNEMFVPSFSLYAVLKEKPPYTYGASFKWLAYSVVPSFVGLKRPDDSYKYYIQYTRAAKVTNQGFTIHHAAGWYLNFGVIGVLAGAVLLAFFVSYGYYRYLRETHTVKKILWFSFFAGTFIFIPRLIRTGPEGYKSIFMISFLFLAIILLCGTFFQVRAKKNS